MTQYCQIQKEHSFDLLDLSIVYYLPGMTFQSSLFSRTLLYCLPYVFFMYGLLLCLSLWYIRFVHGTVINLLLLSYYYCLYCAISFSSFMHEPWMALIVPKSTSSIQVCFLTLYSFLHLILDISIWRSHSSLKHINFRFSFFLFFNSCLIPLDSTT